MRAAFFILICYCHSVAIATSNVTVQATPQRDGLLGTRLLGPSSWTTKSMSLPGTVQSCGALAFTNSMIVIAQRADAVRITASSLQSLVPQTLELTGQLELLPYDPYDLTPSSYLRWD